MLVLATLGTCPGLLRLVRGDVANSFKLALEDWQYLPRRSSRTRVETCSIPLFVYSAAATIRWRSISRMVVAVTSVAARVATTWLASWWRTSCAGAVLAGCYCWSKLDANPSLYARSWFFCSDSHRERFFRGKAVWILGASSGIGEELAYQLSSTFIADLSDTGGTSFRMYLSSRSVDQLERVAERCRKLIRQKLQDGSQVLGEDLVSSVVRLVPVDVADEQSLREAIRSVSDKESDGIDIIFLNAGRGHLSPAVSDTSAETTRRVVEQTALWPMVATPLLLPLFGTRKPAHLVVTSSIAAILPVPLSAVYAASKHALRGYFASLQAEDPGNLRVDMICPGPVNTNFHRVEQRHRNLESSGSPERKTKKTTATNGDGSAVEAPFAAPAPNASPLKMSTSRCVELMVSAVAWPSERGRTVYLCPQPTLTFLYLYPLLPSFVSDRLLRTVGSRRVEIWKDGLELYDPASWRRSRRNGKK